MRDAGIEAHSHFQPLHESLFRRKTGRYEGALNGVLALECSLRIVRLPMFDVMIDDELERVSRESLTFLLHRKIRQ